MDNMPLGHKAGRRACREGFLEERMLELDKKSKGDSQAHTGEGHPGGRTNSSKHAEAGESTVWGSRPLDGWQSTAEETELLGPQEAWMSGQQDVWKIRNGKCKPERPGLAISFANSL